MRVLLAVIVFPLGEQFVAVAVAQLTDKFVGAMLNGAIAQRIHADADGQAGQSIALFGARQHWSLIAQPIDVAEKSTDQQHRNGNSDAHLYASKTHTATSL